VNLDEIIANFESRIDYEDVLFLGREPDAVEAAYRLARAIEFNGGDSPDTLKALNAYWRSVGVDI
jgi:hypothetical protein